MAQTRKDLRGRVLRKGESQRRSDGRYVYTYTDPLGRRKYVYAQDLVTLREKEAQLMKDQMDGLDIYVAGKATINFVFDRYMSLKNNLKPTTKSNYLYMYDRFIRDTFGKRNIAEIKYSDVVQFYNHLIEKQELQINYVITSRFTPEQGYIVESRRGGGGYIRISRVKMDRGTAMMHIINSVGSSLDKATAEVMLNNMLQRNMLEMQSAKLIAAALSDRTLSQVEQDKRDTVRADLFKNMLLTID